MKKKILLTISLILVFSICISVAIFSANGAETDTMKAFQVAAQSYKTVCDTSFDTEDPDLGEYAIVGYYKDVPITQNQVAYKQAMDQLNQNPKKTEKETVFAVAQDLFTFEQAKNLGLYPSEEEMDEAFVAETESFQANLEENLELCTQIGFTQDELIAWMTQQRIENIAKCRFMAQVLISLQEEEEIDDEILAEVVHALGLREEGTGLLSTFDKFYDRYVTLQIGDQITYVNEDTGEENNIVSE